MVRAKEKIDEMIADGVVSTTLWLSEDDYKWGSQHVSINLQAAGYHVMFTEPENEDEIPDMEISIEHLK